MSLQVCKESLEFISRYVYHMSHKLHVLRFLYVTHMVTKPIYVI